MRSSMRPGARSPSLRGTSPLASTPGAHSRRPGHSRRNAGESQQPDGTGGSGSLLAQLPGALRDAPVGQPHTRFRNPGTGSSRQEDALEPFEGVDAADHSPVTARPRGGRPLPSEVLTRQRERLTEKTSLRAAFGEVLTTASLAAWTTGCARSGAGGRLLGRRAFHSCWRHIRFPNPHRD